jgi:hypothetical protein
VSLKQRELQTNITNTNLLRAVCEIRSEVLVSVDLRCPIGTIMCPTCFHRK